MHIHKVANTYVHLYIIYIYNKVNTGRNENCKI